MKHREDVDVATSFSKELQADGNFASLKALITMPFLHLFDERG